MSLKSLSLALLISAASVLAAGHPDTPHFDDYKVAVETKKKAFRLQVTAAEAAQYASQLESAARQPLNFAGHYVLATWGCGAGCVMGGAIDTRTGRVVMLPFSVSNWPLDVVEPLSFRKDSALLIVRGSRNEQGPGIHHYRFDGRGFKFLKTVD